MGTERMKSAAETAAASVSSAEAATLERLSSARQKLDVALEQIGKQSADLERRVAADLEKEVKNTVETVEEKLRASMEAARPDTGAVMESEQLARSSIQAAAGIERRKIEESAEIALVQVRQRLGAMFTEFESGVRNRVEQAAAEVIERAALRIDSAALETVGQCVAELERRSEALAEKFEILGRIGRVLLNSNTNQKNWSKSYWGP
jgi:hypothetical protein